MTNFKSCLKYLIPLWLLTLTVIILTFSHHGELIIDCGREAYYPQEILNGKILYKDLFNIYGPFAYLFNAFLYKIIDIHLNTLNIAGSICAFFIISTIFFIAKRFLTDSFAFSISCLCIAIGIVPVYLFNYVFPYSFGMTYGFLSFLISLLFLISFIDYRKKSYLLISTFFAGLSFACKYEFLPYIILFIFLFIKIKPNLKFLFENLICLIFAPTICFLFLFSKGLNFDDILNTINIIVNMSKTQTLKYFYIHSGVFFHKQTPLLILKTFLTLCIPLFMYISPILFKNKLKNQTVNLILTYGAICLLLLFNIGNSYEIFAFLPILLTILSIIFYKKILCNLALSVLILSTLLVSLKVFWAIIINSYGIYYLPLMLISIFAIIKDKFNKKDLDYIGFFILVLSILIGFSNLKFYTQNNNLISTPKGNIYVSKKYFQTTANLIDFLHKNTKKTDKVLILPEGMLINFLSDRKTDSFYNTILPLYEETFGSKNIIYHFKKEQPEYIIFNNWNSSDYYFSYICKDYALDFCKFVFENYFEKTRLIGAFNYIIFQKK